MLKYSQKNMGAAVEKVKREMEAVLQTLLRKTAADCEGLLVQVLKESRDQKELSKKELQNVLVEKRKALSNLESMQKSFSELLKRFEKQKEATEGFQRNEEALKKCIEDCLEKFKKEERRYQALKAHVEEKLQQAHEEVAQGSSKAKAKWWWRRRRRHCEPVYAKNN